MPVRANTGTPSPSDFKALKDDNNNISTNERYFSMDNEHGHLTFAAAILIFAGVENLFSLKL